MLVMSIDSSALAPAIASSSSCCALAAPTRWNRWTSRAWRMARTQRVGSGNRQFFILLRACRAAHTNRSHNLSFPLDGDPALEWGEIIEGHHRRPALVHDVLKYLRRFLE